METLTKNYSVIGDLQSEELIETKESDDSILEISDEPIIIEHQRKMIEYIKEEIYKYEINESQKKEIENHERDLYEYIISEVQSKCNNFQHDIEFDTKLVENMRQLQKDMIQIQKKVINSLKELLIKYDPELIMKLEMKV